MTLAVCLICTCTANKLARQAESKYNHPPLSHYFVPIPTFFPIPTLFPIPTFWAGLEKMSGLEL